MHFLTPVQSTGYSLTFNFVSLTSVSVCFLSQCLTLELNDILHVPDTLYAFMQFLKAEAAVNVLQFYLTVGQ